jgi:HAAS domain-containing protein
MRTQAGADQLVDRYLSQLDRALGGLSTSRRHQIVEEISAHIGQSRALLDHDDEAGVRALLDRVGDPEAIAAEAGMSEVSTSSRRRDAWVPWLLLFGALPGVASWVLTVGWFVGIGFLWSSRAWKVRDKFLGTLVIPGGLLPLGILLLHPVAGSTCTSHGGPGIPTVTHCVTSGFTLPPVIAVIVFVVVLVAPIGMAIHLERARRDSERRS